MSNTKWSNGVCRSRPGQHSRRVLDLQLNAISGMEQYGTFWDNHHRYRTVGHATRRYLQDDGPLPAEFEYARAQGMFAVLNVFPTIHAGYIQMRIHTEEKNRLLRERIHNVLENDCQLYDVLTGVVFQYL